MTSRERFISWNFYSWPFICFRRIDTRRHEITPLRSCEWDQTPTIRAKRTELIMWQLSQSGKQTWYMESELHSIWDFGALVMLSCVQNLSLLWQMLCATWQVCNGIVHFVISVHNEVFSECHCFCAKRLWSVFLHQRIASDLKTDSCFDWVKIPA